MHYGEQAGSAPKADRLASQLDVVVKEIAVKENPVMEVVRADTPVVVF